MVTVTASTGDIAAAARACAAFDSAHRLAVWVGEGRRVTPRQVLRPADVPDAADALGVTAPPRVRTAADLSTLHRPWRIAVTVGLLDITGTHARPGPALGGWPEPDDEAVCGMWLSALPAALATTAADLDEAEAPICARVLLAGLATNPGAAPEELRRWGREAIGDEHSETVFGFFTGWYRLISPLPAALDCLTEFGALQRDHAGHALTPLGHWGLHQLLARARRPITSDITAGELITRLANIEPDEQWYAAQAWLRTRDPLPAATELLSAAATAPPSQRVAAALLADALGPAAEPAWAAVATHNTLGPHARAHDLVPGEPDVTWLAIEYAAAALHRDGPDEAHSWLHECLPGDGIDAWLPVLERTGHPAAAELVTSITKFLDTGTTPISARSVQLKISLDRMRPAVWRRVLVPAAAPLTLLHHVIQIVMGWDGDHLHKFGVGRKDYGDPDYTPDYGDEEGLRLGSAFTTTNTITYNYDFGDCWDHTIRCEKLLDPPNGTATPVCVAGRGDAPVEDWTSGPHSVPFDLDDINRRLTHLRGEP